MIGDVACNLVSTALYRGNEKCRGQCWSMEQPIISKHCLALLKVHMDHRLKDMKAIYTHAKLQVSGEQINSKLL